MDEKLIKEELLKNLLTEANELKSIFMASRKTAAKNSKRK